MNAAVGSFARRAVFGAARFVRGHVVLSVAAFAALATMAFVPPDAAYAGYVDARTLACLFSILAVAGALRRLGAFTRAARFVVRRFSQSRSAVASIVAATAVLSMFATNDMALVMMLPLSAATLVRAGWARLLPFTFVMQGLVANLGGMIMPFGNPQNLYLYSYYGIDLKAFLSTMALPFALSMGISAICLAVALRRSVPAASCQGTEAVEGEQQGPFDVRRLVLYLVLFAASVGMVVRVLPAPVVVCAVVVVLAVTDRGALREVDWALLATFLCFFVFSGNLARIPAVESVLGDACAAAPLAASAGLSQIISNVPAAVVLSHFTDVWAPLLVGVNIGGAGTLVGSLASLITLQQYAAVSKLRAVRAESSCRMGRFLAVFFAFNFFFLAVLFAACAITGGTW